MLRSARKPKILKRYLRLEQLEDRIVLDAAVADNPNSKAAQGSATQEPGTGTDQGPVVDTVSQAKAPDAAPGDAPGAGVIALNQVFGKPLHEVLVTNTAYTINGVGDHGEHQDNVRVLLISSSVANADVLAGATKSGVVTIVYDDAEVTPATLLQTLNTALGGEKAASIAIATHRGDPGQFSLTSDQTVSLENLSKEPALQSFWAGVGGLLVQGGRIDILSCNVAANDSGNLLIQKLESISGHSVAASENPTGNAAFGGDWVLETKNVDLVATYFVPEKISKFDGKLGTISMTGKDGWVAIMSGSNFDPSNDEQANKPSADLVGNATHAVLYSSFDDATKEIGYRFRVTAPGNNPTFGATGAIGIDANSDGKIDIFVSVDDRRSAGTWVQLWNPGNSANISPSSTSWVDANRTETNVGYNISPVSATNDPDWDGNSNIDAAPVGKDTHTDHFVTFKLSFQNIIDELAESGIIIDKTSPLRYVLFTTVQNNAINADIGGVNGQTNSTTSYAALGAFSPIVAASPYPIPVNDAYNTTENTYVSGNILSNDRNSYSASLAQGPAHGFVTLKADGTFTYVPTAGYSGTDTFTYDSYLGNTKSAAPATVTINVTPAPLPPVAVGDTFSTNENSVVTGNVLANDSDPNGNLAGAQLVSGPAHGTINLNANGTFSYTPMTGYSGPDSFVYKAVDSGGLTSAATTVSITVVDVLHPPVANNDTFSATEDGGPFAFNVLANDTDADYDALTIVAPAGSWASAKGGSLTVVDGKVHYSPAADFNGEDSFTYTISDGHGGTDTATVTVNVAAVNDTPVANVQTFGTDEDAALSTQINLTNMDPDDPTGANLTVELVSTPLHGTLRLNDHGTFTYTPDPDYYTNLGEFDTFGYRVTDPDGASSTGTVKITVNAKPDAPVANPDSAVVNEGESIAINVLGNDTDGDGNSLTVDSINTLPAHGQVTKNADGTITYKADLNYSGTDTFVYQITDGTGLTDPANGTVTVTVKAVGGNDAPKAIDDEFTVAEDSSISSTVLGNDTDPNGDTLTVTPQTVTTENGKLVLNADGTFTYTPNANWVGSEEFTYEVSDRTDGTGLTSTAKLIVTVAAVNDPPVATDDNSTTRNPIDVTTPEDSPLTVNVLSNDSDIIDGDSLSVQSVSNGTHGTVQIVDATAGTVKYTPAPNYHGSDNFTYVVSDGNGGTDTATVTLSVSAVDDDPIAKQDTITTNEDTVFNGNVSLNDSDPDGDPMTFSLASGATTQGGTVSMVTSGDTAGTYTYTPKSNFSGTDSFDYTLTAGGKSVTATVTITVLPVNDPPVASDDTGYTTSMETALTITTASGLLKNDSDPDSGDQLTVTANTVDSANGGRVSLNADGTFTYTPKAGFIGNDTFVYEIKDTSGATAQATATVTVTGSNHSPVANNDTYTGLKTRNNPYTIAGTVLENDTDADGDSLSVTSVTQTSGNGSAVVSGDGKSIIFTAPSGQGQYLGTFDYTITDGKGGTCTATVSFNSRADDSNTPPVANNDTGETTQGTPVTIDVLSNDTDDNNTKILSSVSSALHGAVVKNANGTVTYTSDSNWHGIDTFTYVVSDGVSTDTGTVTVTVSAVLHAPDAVDDAVTIVEDTPVTINVLGNDTDADGDTLTIKSVNTTDTQGTVSIESGKIQYTPKANWSGTDTFTYTIDDGTDRTAPATVTVTVNPVNDPPNAESFLITMDEDATKVVSLLDHASDADHDELSVSIVDQPFNGTLSVGTPGSYTYTPNPNFNGTDTFNYSVSDGSATSTATVTIQVNSVTEAPVANTDLVTTTEDAPATGNVLTNDSDGDPTDTLTVVVSTDKDTDPTFGTVVRNEDGSFIYTPRANFYGTDSFTYVVTDGTNETVGTVTITVLSVNDVPVATDDNSTTRNPIDVTTPEDSPLTVNVLSNDSDADNDHLTVTIVTGPENGAVVVNSDSTITYTPAKDFVGADTFVYRASDGTTGDNASVTITVTSVDDLPVAGSDSATTPEDHPVTVNVLNNDYDVDSGAPSLVDPAGTKITADHGEAVINGDGTITYTPAKDFSGKDTFTYEIMAGGKTATGTVTVTVTAAPDAPSAVDDAVTIVEDTAVTINVLGNDTDADGDTLTIKSVNTTDTQGTVSIESGKTIKYTPKANWSGTDTFTYTIDDGTDRTAPATVTVTVNPVNDLPEAKGGSFTTEEDKPREGFVADLLSRDSDVDGDNLSWTVVAGASHGSVLFKEDGKFTYTPDSNYYGSDSFVYQVSDGNGGIDTARVAIDVTPVNDEPVANPDTVTTVRGLAPIKVDVLGNDSDVEGGVLTPSLAPDKGPLHGTLMPNVDGTFTYTPDPTFTGTDNFTYQITDSGGESSTSTVSVTVRPANKAPVATDDVGVATEDQVLTGNVLTNDTDADGDPLTAELVTGPTRGNLVLNADGAFSYTPDQNYFGFDIFTYRVSDPFGGTDTATAQIHVKSVNDAPTASNDTIPANEHNQIVLDVLANDRDPDGDPLTAEVVGSGPAKGTLSTNPDGTLTYTPGANFDGTDSFQYVAKDSDGAPSSVATVTIGGGSPNHPPVAVNYDYQTNENSSVGGSVLPDPGGLTAELVGGAAHGTLAFNSDGTFTYNPAPDYNGPDAFTYRLMDASGASSTATVTITVAQINLPPVANPDDGVVQQNDTLFGNVLVNDSDPESREPLTSLIVSNPTHGSLELNPNGTFAYSPDKNYSGTDVFTYLVMDAQGATAQATVTISVKSLGDVNNTVDLLPIKLFTFDSVNEPVTEPAGFLDTLQKVTVHDTTEKPIDPVSADIGNVFPTFFSASVEGESGVKNSTHLSAGTDGDWHDFDSNLAFIQGTRNLPTDLFDYHEGVTQGKVVVFNFPEMSLMELFTNPTVGSYLRMEGEMGLAGFQPEVQTGKSLVFNNEERSWLELL